jgi:hypothetical protein
VHILPEVIRQAPIRAAAAVREQQFSIARPEGIHQPACKLAAQVGDLLQQIGGGQRVIIHFVTPLNPHSPDKPGDNRVGIEKSDLAIAYQVSLIMTRLPIHACQWT